MNAAARVLLAEPDGPTRTGLRLLLRREGYDVLEATDLEAGLEHAERGGADVALIAVELPGGGLRLAAALADAAPGCRVIMLSPSPGGEELVAAVLAGAAGYLSKDISLDRLPHAVRGVLDGEVALPRRYTQHLLETLRGRHRRSDRAAPHLRAARQARRPRPAGGAGDAAPFRRVNGYGFLDGLRSAKLRATIDADMTEIADFPARIDRLCALASAAPADEALLSEMEDVLAEGYLEALRGEARSRRLGTRLEDLLGALDQPASALEARRVAREKRTLDRAVGELRARLGTMREQFARLGGGNPVAS